MPIVTFQGYWKVGQCINEINYISISRYKIYVHMIIADAKMLGDKTHHCSF